MIDRVLLALLIHAGATLFMTGLVWLSAFPLPVPRHAEPSAGFEARAHLALVRTNWLRAAVWTVSAGLALAMLGAAAG